MIKSWQIKRNAFCNYPFQRLKIDPEGNCAFCCFQRRKSLGNILESSLEEVWNNPIAKQIRKETLEGKLHTSCAIESCPFYWQKELKEIQFLEYDFPVQFEIDLPNTHCNIGGTSPTPDTACLMCERANPKFKPHVDRIDEVCEKIKPFMKFANGVHIQGVAEPFWKDRIFEIIDMAGIEPYKEKITISTTTNGTILSDKRIEKWLSYPNTCITFSLDSATPETYKKIRKLDAYHAVVKSLMKIAERRKGLQGLFIHNNINMINILEVKGMVELAAKAKVNEINFNPTYNLEGLVISDQNAHIFKKAESEIIETAKRLNVQIAFVRNMTLNYNTENLVQLKLIKV